MSTAWVEDHGTDVTSSFLGITTPLNELYAEIAKQGWELQKVESPKKDGLFQAAARSPHGEKLLAEGRSAADAVAQLLMRVMRTNFMRAGAVRLGMWQTNWTDKLPEIAQAYAKAPIYDPKATGAWIELAQDSVRRAQVLQSQLTIEVVDNPEPYATPQEMFKDIHEKKHFYVSRANAHHPVWSVDQNVAFRIVHDVLGHAISGGDFGWQGENRACMAHFPLLSPNAQRALFGECIAQTAYAIYYRTFGPQKVAFLDDFLEEAQNKENPAGFVGVHPSQTVAPVATPQVGPSIGDDEASPFPDGYVAPHMEGLGLTPVMTKTAGSLMDPNAGWQSGIDPLPNNAFEWQGDPLDAHTEGGMVDTVGKIETGWHSQVTGDGQHDYATAKQAIINAFRCVLLSPRKDLKWNVIHYQHIMNVPAEVDDPKRYWDTLEQQREAWNQARGHAPGSHKPYWKAERDFAGYVRTQNPTLSDPDARELAQREWQGIWNDEEERIAGDPKNAKLSAEEIERKVAKDIERRILTVLKSNQNEATDVPDDQMSLLSAINPTQIDFEGNEGGKYGAWMGTHLKAIAQISQNADAITQAALEDVREHDATGHHFRARVLSLGIPGVGPKVCSFAWLLLQPLTSQLATIDTHMMDVLGHQYEKDMTARDYFKFERELAAGRDAAGYGHVPLGAFQWGMWDHKRSGPGAHQDHSAMRVLDPVPHDLIDWQAKQQTGGSGTDEYKRNWAQNASQWWQDTQPARQTVGDDWDDNVAGDYSAATIPFQQEPSLVTAAAQDGDDDEFCVAFQIPHEVKNKIANWAATLEWPEVAELDDPEEYHCTVLYAHGGWHEEANHAWLSQYRLHNLPVEAWKLDLFGPEQDTLVLRLKSEPVSDWATRLMEEAEKRGLDVSRFPGGYKPHITIAKGVTKIPAGDPLRLHFRSGPLFLYDPRPLQDDTQALRQAIASAGRSPWFVNDAGEVVEGDPGQSLMHHLRNTLGLTTQEAWALDPESGKR